MIQRRARFILSLWPLAPIIWLIVWGLDWLGVINVPH